MPFEGDKASSEHCRVRCLEMFGVIYFALLLSFCEQNHYLFQVLWDPLHVRPGTGSDLKPAIDTWVVAAFAIKADLLTTRRPYVPAHCIQ